MYGPFHWPVYDDLGSRIKLLRSYGVDAVLHLDFTHKDLKARAADFFEVIFATVPLAELWLGTRQLLGSGPAGGPETVARLAEQYQLQVKRLPEADLSGLSREVRMLLSAGKPAQARQLMNRPPVLSRPDSGLRLETAWKPGLYQALAVSSPAESGDGLFMEILVTEVPEGERYLTWPNPQIDYLAFMAGPNDQDERASELTQSEAA